MMEKNYHETKFDKSVDQSSSGHNKVNADNESQENSLMKTPVPQMVQTLPNRLNSMVGVSIEIENDNAQELIEMLGKKIGINDYQTNLASFWLLDTMALEVMRIRDKINAADLGIVTSWIAGEAKLIQENSFSRKQFFRAMNIRFVKVFTQLRRGKPLMYWESVSENNDIDVLQHEDNISGPFSEYESEGPNGLSEYEVVTMAHGNSTSLNERSQTVLDNGMKILEAIMESTYMMYGNAFHYAIVYAALAQPIEIRSNQLPYTLRLPRPVKPSLTLSPKSKTSNERVGQNTQAKTDKEKSGEVRGKEKVKSKFATEIPSPPAPMINEEMMTEDRKQILPLMESNEALQIFEQFTKPENVTVATGIDTGKKQKRKIKPNL